MPNEIWFTSDTHFGHEFMAQLRGFVGPAHEFSAKRTLIKINEHDDFLIDAWNDKVRPGDIVYHLGDFALPQIQARVEELLRSLNGTKQLIIGNHERVQTQRARGWAWVGHYKYRKIRPGFKVAMNHYAMRTWQGSHNGSFHVYGHSHGMLPDHGRSMDVGVDTRPDMGPWNVEEVYDILKDCGFEYHLEAEIGREGQDASVDMR